jgi:TetR/AcrR family transcriptional regulator of autoinduction and epiphytic fitness
VTTQRSQGCDPRIERSRRVIRQAALAELAAVGYGAFSIESVASRAGVAKTTVYRHWGNKVALIADALETLNQQPDPRGGHDRAGGQATPRQRVEALLRHLAEVLTRSTFSACVPALVEAAEHDPAVRDFYHAYSARRRQALTDAIADGIAAGDFPPEADPEEASLAMSGALFYRRLMTDRPYHPDDTTALIATVLGPARSGGDGAMQTSSRTATERSRT